MKLATRIRVAREFGKWPHEVRELDTDEYRKIVAFLRYEIEIARARAEQSQS